MNKKISNFIKVSLLIVLLFSIKGIAHASSVNLTVRDGSTVVFTGSVLLPTGITSLNDSTNTPETVDPSSAIAVLDSAATQPGSTWSLSNLTYYSSFSSLYLKCITDSMGNKCDNWQYVVNGSYPSDGMDKTILKDGDTVYVYFGPQNQVTLNSNSITTNDTLTATAQKYDYQNNAWITRTGVTIGLTQPDPNNTFSPIEIKTLAVDANGQAIFSNIATGSYNVGIKEDYYFPTTSLTVTQAPVLGSGGGQLINGVAPGASPTPTPTVTQSVIPSPPTKLSFDTKKALAFILAQQKNDGSFGDELYTDWAAISLATGENQTQTIQLIKYFTQSNPQNLNLTDYERHAMALMVLGLNPYNSNGENYIDKIVKSFDGKQFGDPNEDNDDIFALIVLQNAGYTINDEIINTDINFILNAQNSDGSWNGSVDMTGAAMEALSVFKDNDLVRNALGKAENYLEQTQKDDGSWNENASSTAWAIEGILTQNEKPENWASKNGHNTPLDYLTTVQDTDGGIKDSDLNTKIWETEYVNSALSMKTWNQIMQNYPRQDLPVPAQSLPSTIQTPTNTVSIKKTEHKIAIVPKTENTATIINAITPTTQTTQSKNWFLALLEKIF